MGRKAFNFFVLESGMDSIVTGYKQAQKTIKQAGQTGSSAKGTTFYF